MDSGSNNNRKRNVSPVRFYDELAEFGILEEYLEDRFRDNLEKDADFRVKMQNILTKYSVGKTSKSDVQALEKLCEGLEFFLEYTKLWRKSES